MSLLGPFDCQRDSLSKPLRHALLRQLFILHTGVRTQYLLVDVDLVDAILVRQIGLKHMWDELRNSLNGKNGNNEGTEFGSAGNS